MLFHTWTFAVFFLVAYPVHLALRHTRFRSHWLLLVSYVFYGAWNPLYLLLIVYSTWLDYACVNRMAKSPRKKFWLGVSIVNNLGLLGFYKYAGFVTDNLNALLAGLGSSFHLPAPDVLLPVGISFYTFQSMSYTIDFYRGHIEREPSFIRFAAFVSLFPQLVAGPIERASNLLPQLQRNTPITRQAIAEGMSLFVVGLFKKVAIADYLAVYVDKVYSDPGQHHSPALILATFAFGWQIFCDFSGYTDMARGIGRMMGFRFMLNFNNPYLATGLGDFWARWHISLSTWFRDYVYIPLGGNRKGTWGTYQNMFITMVISGFWHGAAWTFLVWGLLHALGRVGTRELERTAVYRERVPKLVKQLMVFTFVTFTWIFFRAEDMPQAWTIISRIFTSGWADPQFPLLALGLVLALWAYQYMIESRAKVVFDNPAVRVAGIVAMVAYVAVFSAASDQAFIYFQF
ncbi:MAG: MBOAT family protein [Candidatus Hydrogenedentes bacterium]|nr:MBOAT family protein [Candidatus Hydrogenedentota bacterium]